MTAHPSTPRTTRSLASTSCLKMTFWAHLSWAYVSKPVFSGHILVARREVCWCPLHLLTFWSTSLGVLWYGDQRRWLDSDPKAQDWPDLVQPRLEAVQKRLWIHPRRLLAGQWPHLPSNKAAQCAQDWAGGTCWKREKRANHAWTIT